MSTAAHLTDDGTKPFSCLDCHAREQCLPAGMNDTDCAKVEGFILQQHHLRRGATLQSIHEPVLGRLYAIRHGQFKSYQLDHRGEQCITRLSGNGDLLGLDSISLKHYTDTTTAVCDSIVCEFSYVQLVETGQHFPGLFLRLEQMLSKELARLQDLTLLLRYHHAEQKFAQFLLQLVWKETQQNGKGPYLDLVLSRKEVADYLSLTHATIARLLSRLQRLGILSVRHRHLQLLDKPALKQIAAGQYAPSQATPESTLAHAIF
jgi:CRP/FNR family transcriptional regulator